MLLFLPPRAQALLGIAAVVLGVALHLWIVAALGVVGLVVGGVRWVHGRRKGALQR
jgi:type IV secretory pathway TrbD component